MNLPRAIIDPIDHAPIADSVSQSTSEFAGESLDVVVTQRILFQLCETPRELACQGSVRIRVKCGGFR